MFDYSFLDLDKTIFDCARFERDILAVMEKYGVTEEDYKNTYFRSLHTLEPDLYDYNFEEHLKILEEIGYEFDASAMVDLNRLLENNYLFEEAGEFVKFLKSVSKKMVLLSAGDEKFQMAKIKATGVDGLFDKVEVIPGRKEKYLQNNGYSGRIIFINDSLRENKAIKESLPEIMIITKATPTYKKEDFENSGLPYFHTLNEIKEYVQRNIK